MAVPAQIEGAFRELRERGYFAQGEYEHCQGCARNRLMGEGIEDRLVFYDRERDTEMLSQDSSCYLAWDGEPLEIIQVLERHGLAPEWDGAGGSRIKITWTKRH